MSVTTTGYTYRPIPLEESRIDMRATDLRDEYTPGDEYGIITLYGSAETAEYVYKPGAGRIGIAWGADARWADAPNAEEGVRLWVEDPEAYEALN